MRRLTFRVLFLLLVCGFFLTAPPASGQDQANLNLVHVRDHLEGSFLGHQATSADDKRIYLGNNRGRIQVLARDSAGGFPLLETVTVAGSAIKGLAGDHIRIFAAVADGTLSAYEKGDVLVPLRVVPLSNEGLNSISLVGDQLYLSTGQAELAADEPYIYFSPLNKSERVLELSSETFEVQKTYGEDAEIGATTVFDRRTGRKVGSIANPLDLYARISQVTIYVDQSLLVLTTPGCCGRGAFIYNPLSLAFLGFIPRASLNVVAHGGRFLFAGNEDGWVEVYDFTGNSPKRVTGINLRASTKHSGAEDIEIRALLWDERAQLIFAASSWGNDESRVPSLPSFFILAFSTSSTP